jgi:hypothetical protein
MKTTHNLPETRVIFWCRVWMGTWTTEGEANRHAEVTGASGHHLTPGHSPLNECGDGQMLQDKLAEDDGILQLLPHRHALPTCRCPIFYVFLFFFLRLCLFCFLDFMVPGCFSRSEYANSFLIGMLLPAGALRWIHFQFLYWIFYEPSTSGRIMSICFIMQLTCRCTAFPACNVAFSRGVLPCQRFAQPGQPLLLPGFDEAGWCRPHQGAAPRAA